MENLILNTSIESNKVLKFQLVLIWKILKNIRHLEDKSDKS